MRGMRMRHMHRFGDDHRGHGGHGRRRARRGSIRVSVLRLLNERPMHGYELIQEFEQRTGGRWRPSPGSVYPTLAQLEDEGLVTATDVEGRKRFELTDAGRTWLEEHQDDEQTLPWEHPGGGRTGELRRLSAEIVGNCASCCASELQPSWTGRGKSCPARAVSCTSCWPLRCPTTQPRGEQLRDQPAVRRATRTESTPTRSITVATVRPARGAPPVSGSALIGASVLGASAVAVAVNAIGLGGVAATVAEWPHANNA